MHRTRARAARASLRAGVGPAPLFYGGTSADAADPIEAALCAADALPAAAAGTIVICERGGNIARVAKVSGARRARGRRGGRKERWQVRGLIQYRRGPFFAP